MVRERFTESFEQLREQSNRLADVERSPENYDEIVAERIELDRLRKEATIARKGIVSRYEPPAPDVVEPYRGSTNTGRFGKAGAIVSCALIVGIALTAFFIVRDIGNGLAVELQEVSETITDDCTWRVDATVLNNSEAPIRVDRVETVLNRAFFGATITSKVEIPAGEARVVSASWPPGRTGGCVDSPADIDHGNLILHFEGGVSVTRGF